MRLASKLLHMEGILVQYDAVGTGGFGDMDVMQAFAEDESLGLQLASNRIPPNSYHNGRERMLVLWQKTCG